jgi:hypothetical protein
MKQGNLNINPSFPIIVKTGSEFSVSKNIRDYTTCLRSYIPTLNQLTETGLDSEGYLYERGRVQFLKYINIFRGFSLKYAGFGACFTQIDLRRVKQLTVQEIKNLGIEIITANREFYQGAGIDISTLEHQFTILPGRALCLKYLFHFADINQFPAPSLEPINIQHLSPNVNDTEIAILSDEQKQQILDLALKKTTLEFIYKTYPYTVDSAYVLHQLQLGSERKDASVIEYGLLLGFLINSFTLEYTGILNELILDDWHFKHEDIASILQDLRSPTSVDALYKAALSQLKYLDYDDSYALARKCIHALGDIDTAYSKEKLRLLATSKIPIVKEKAEKQLHYRRN